MGQVGKRQLRNILLRDSNEEIKSPCKLCDIQDWSSEEFDQLGRDIFDRGVAKGRAIQHRKLWEFVQTIRALKINQLLNSESIGLSVAAGSERILFYLANYLGRIVATDIYGQGNFAGLEASDQMLKDAKPFAPYAYPEDRLKVFYMNALKLCFPKGFFDFAFCLSSIEHFGGVRVAINALQEMAQVVRPGGLVIITTECSLNGRITDQVFSVKQLEQLIQAVPELELAHPLELSLSEDTLRYLVDMRREDISQLPHINLRAFASVFTSICLVFRKKATTKEIFLGDRFQYIDNYLPTDSLDSEIEIVNQKVSPARDLLKIGVKKARSLWFRIEEFLQVS